MKPPQVDFVSSTHMKKHINIFGKVIKPNTNTIIDKRKQVRIEPRIMRLLMLLYASRGKVVDKNTLINEIWKGTVVTEDSLTKAISKLRQVLDNGQGASVIETIHGVGYLLRKPTLSFQLKQHKTTLVLTSIIVFLVYFMIGSGLVQWAVGRY